MVTIIAEKPSVAREIASLVGAKNRKDGYIEGNGYNVTWAFGHLLSLAMPADYGFIGFVKENLPILPKRFIIKPIEKRGKDGKYQADEGVLKQLKIIEGLFDNSESIINATDAGREGELIFRYIYDYLGCTKPVQRLWISSLTEAAIKKGLNELKDGKDYDRLSLAAYARAESDWMVGINASQALSISAGRGTFSLGRVQTPTLAMICKRFLENQNFVSTPFWTIRTNTNKDESYFDVISTNKYEDKNLADEDFSKIENKKLTVKSVEKKTVNEEPPLLYDLTTLQKEANTKLNLSADQTLSIAQKLYEAKVITYPRTGSRYISEDIFETIPDLLNSIPESSPYSSFAKKLIELNRKSVNDSKVTDHHALLITGLVPSDLSDTENKIYDMILSRMVEAFSPKCIKESTKALFDCNGIEFSVSGTIINSLGWRAVKKEKEEDENNIILPFLEKGDNLLNLKSELIEGKTKPKPLLTESSLLGLMESAGKELENEEERLALKGAGIGTPATRASIIETLFMREYIKREKKSLIPTEKGLSVYDIVKDQDIANVSLTGQWENALSRIEEGRLEIEKFNLNIVSYTQKITTELLASDIEVKEELVLCPRCKKEGIKVFPKVAKCKECELAVFRTILNKTMTDSQLLQLLSKGKTPVIKGFQGKNKPFDARIAFDKDFKTVFEFDNTKGKSFNKYK